MLLLQSQLLWLDLVGRTFTFTQFSNLENLTLTEELLSIFESCSPWELYIQCNLEADSHQQLHVSYKVMSAGENHDHQLRGDYTLHLFDHAHLLATKSPPMEDVVVTVKDSCSNDLHT